MRRSASSFSIVAAGEDLLLFRERPGVSGNGLGEHDVHVAAAFVGRPFENTGHLGQKEHAGKGPDGFLRTGFDSVKEDLLAGPSAFFHVFEDDADLHAVRGSLPFELHDHACDRDRVIQYIEMNQLSVRSRKWTGEGGTVKKGFQQGRLSLGIAAG